MVKAVSHIRKMGVPQMDMMSSAKRAGKHMSRAAHHLTKAAYHAGSKEFDTSKVSQFATKTAQEAGRGVVLVGKRLAGAAYHEGKKEAIKGSKELMSLAKDRVKHESKKAVQSLFQAGAEYVTR